MQAAGNGIDKGLFVLQLLYNTHALQVIAGVQKIEENRTNKDGKDVRVLQGKEVQDDVCSASEQCRSQYLVIMNERAKEYNQGQNEDGQLHHLQTGRQRSDHDPVGMRRSWV